MLKDKLGKVECKFYTNVILYCKDKMVFHLGYQYDGNGLGNYNVFKGTLQVKTLFSWCGKFFPPPLNNMEVPAHFPDVWIKDVAIETHNLLVEIEYASMFHLWKGLEFSPRLQITHMVLINSQITKFEPFDRFHCLRDWIQPKNKVWTKSGPFFFVKQISLSMLCEIQRS